MASNKFLAKIASEMDKPDGLTVVPSSPEEIVAFLAPLPVTSLWGVGGVTNRLLGKAGIRTVGDLQAASESAIDRSVGQGAASHLCRLARGEDDRDVETERKEKSMSREETRHSERREKLSRTVDTIRRRFGDKAIGRAKTGNRRLPGGTCRLHDVALLRTPDAHAVHGA